MADFIQGALLQQQGGVEAVNDVTVAIRNWYANRNPLYTRLRHVPTDRVDFLMYTHKYRARSTTLGVAISSNATTALTFADTTFLMNHDVLELVDSSTGNTERVQVNGDPTGATTVNVTRGVSGTAALASVANGSTVNLIGSSRTGSEVNQTGLTTLGGSRTQYCQTFQFPVQVGGSAQTTRAAVMPGGVQSPFDFNKTMQLQNMVDDIEVSMYRGIGQAPNDAAGTTAKMNGLQTILSTNNTSTPTNAAAYKSSDFIRDTLQACRTGGGEPNLLLVATNFMSAFAIWGQAIMRIPAGETVFGVPIELFEAPFLRGAYIVEAPLLPPFSAICLTFDEVYFRPKRNSYWQPRGIRGDMAEGDWLSEGAIEVVNESHHAYVSGITAFSPN